MKLHRWEVGWVVVIAGPVFFPDRSTRCCDANRFCGAAAGQLLGQSY